MTEIYANSAYTTTFYKMTEHVNINAKMFTVLSARSPISAQCAN